MKFVHIPKTAGLSIATTYREQKWGVYDNTLKTGSSIPIHDPAFLKEFYKNEVTFCVIRNPIDRLLSAYKYRGMPDDPESLNNTILKWRIEIGKNPSYSMNHFMPQYHYAQFCTHILKFNNLEEELNELLKKYKIPIKKLLKINCPRKKYTISRDSISKENMDWILDYYKKDFELF